MDASLSWVRPADIRSAFSRAPNTSRLSYVVSETAESSCPAGPFDESIPTQEIGKQLVRAPYESCAGVVGGRAPIRLPDWLHDSRLRAAGGAGTGRELRPHRPSPSPRGTSPGAMADTRQRRRGRRGAGSVAAGVPI